MVIFFSLSLSGHRLQSSSDHLLLHIFRYSPILFTVINSCLFTILGLHIAVFSIPYTSGTRLPAPRNTSCFCPTQPDFGPRNHQHPTLAHCHAAYRPSHIIHITIFISTVVKLNLLLWYLLLGIIPCGLTLRSAAASSTILLDLISFLVPFCSALPSVPPPPSSPLPVLVSTINISMSPLCSCYICAFLLGVILLPHC